MTALTSVFVSGASADAGSVPDGDASVSGQHDARTPHHDPQPRHAEAGPHAARTTSQYGYDATPSHGDTSR